MHRERRHVFAVVGALATVTGSAPLASPDDEHKAGASALVEQLKAPEPGKRSGAAIALVKVRPLERRTLEALIDTLDDRYEDVRNAVRLALNKLSLVEGFNQVAAGLSRPPRPINIAQPRYPRDAFDKHVEGKVVLEILVASDGSVTRATVRESVPGLDEAAKDCVLKWIFAPAVQNGRFESAIALAPVDFRID